MEFKDILVYLDDGDSNVERVNTAFSLALESNARLTGVTLSSLKPEHLKVSDKKALAKMCEQEAEKRADAFAALAEEQGIEVRTRIIHRDKVAAAERLAQVARNFDLVILRQANPQNPNYETVEEIAQQVILLSGRPVFFMPYIGAHRIPCKNAMIAWDGTPTAARAVHDALPILKSVAEVFILVVQEGKKKTAPGELLADDLASHLQRHGVNAMVKRISSGTFDVQTVILNQIADNDIDLLVMGGYGTPSLKQKIFGGVTRSLLSSMIIPVIMSH
jgi:nucleotide-binding universal stress UspA family protein